MFKFIRWLIKNEEERLKIEWQNCHGEICEVDK